MVRIEELTGEFTDKMVCGHSIRFINSREGMIKFASNEQRELSPFGDFDNGIYSSMQFKTMHLDNDYDVDHFVFIGADENQSIRQNVLDHELGHIVKGHDGNTDELSYFEREVEADRFIRNISWAYVKFMFVAVITEGQMLVDGNIAEEIFTGDRRRLTRIFFRWLFRMK